MITQEAANLIFHEARTHNAWADKPVDDALLKQIYDMAKMGPTSFNCSPMRIVFVKSAEAKEKLKPHLMEANAQKTMAAPATAIIAYDLNFHHHFKKLVPHVDARAFFEGNDPLIQDTAYRNGSLQGAYFIIAARALGLDCGPMSGFDQKGVDEAFFKGTPYKSNFLCNLGYGDKEKLYPRAPRFDFDEACEIA